MADGWPRREPGSRHSPVVELGLQTTSEACRVHTTAQVAFVGNQSDFGSKSLVQNLDLHCKAMLHEAKKLVMQYNASAYH